jgi:hypothetical protein
LFVTHRGDLGAHRDQLGLSLLPVALRDQLLDLHEFAACGQRDLIVADLTRGAEQHRPQAVQRIARPRAVHDRPESTDAQHRGGRRPHHAQTTAVPARVRASVPGFAGRLLGQTGVECRYRLRFGDQADVRWPPVFVAPAAE